MKLIYNSIIFLLCVPIAELSAQYVTDDYRSELTISLGSFFYTGDLTDNIPVLSESQLAWGLAYTHNLNRELSLILGFHRGRIQAFDSNNGTSSSKYFRNLNFRTQLDEFSLMVGYDVVSLFKERRRNAKFRSKVLFGLAYFRFDPEGFYQDNWHRLQPLGTEGQGLEQYPKRDFYSLTQWSIPFGGMIAYKLNESYELSLSFRWNKTFTDYIDDASLPSADTNLIFNERGALAAALSDRYINTDGSPFPQEEGVMRGDSSDQDWYGIFKIGLSYRFNEYWVRR